MRARNIKPGLVKNSTLGTGDIHIQFLFACLPMLADKEGRLKDDPLWIRAEIFPYRPQIDINGYLTVLSRSTFIKRYEVGGKRYIQITNFKEHQHPHHTEKDSIIPPLTDITGDSPLDNGGNPADSLIPDSLIPDSGEAQAEGGKPIKFSLKEPPAEWIDFAATEKNWDRELIIDIWKAFSEHFTTGDGKNKKRLDWFLSWKTWVRRENIRPRQGKPITKAVKLGGGYE